MTKVEVEAMFEREHKRISTASASLDVKLPHSNKVTAKQFLIEYKVLKFEKFDGHKGNTREHVAHFLDFMGHFSNDIELCI